MTCHANKPPRKPIPREKKPRGGRPFAAYHREMWQSVFNCPSGYAALLAPRGNTTRRSLLCDVAIFMDVMISQMELTTRKIGVVQPNGFFLFPWKKIAELMNVSENRVKDCSKYARERGWITSEQPKELKDGEWTCLASIKRITLKYFEDFNLLDKYEIAKARSIELIVKRAEKQNCPVAFLLTPISLLRKIKKTLTTSWEVYFDDYKNRKRCADIPY